MTTSFDFQIVRDPEDFRALQPEWDALWSRSLTPRFSQSFAWCLAGWKTTGEPRKRSLHIVVMRANGRAVLIWPMVLKRRFGCRLATALGSESTEYDSVLVENGPDASAHLRAAWVFVQRHCRVDVVAVPFVRHDTDMHQILSTATAHRVVHTLPSPFTTWDNVASWDAYARSLSSNLRTGLARRRRRLAELGRISFELIDDPAEQAATIDWTLRRKIDWMSQKEKANNFLATQEYRNFLLTISEQSPVAGRLGIFALKCDERIMAAKIVAVDESRCEGFITVYDPAFAAYSPGQIILADCLKWCQEQGLTYDFRIGEESYKRDWANGDCLATTYHLANTWLGVLQLAAATALRNGRQAKDRLRTCIPADSRRRTKARLLALRERLSRGYAPQVEISLNA